MTAAQAASRRPTKPRRSLILPLGVAVFLLITWASASREFGIGLDIGRLAANLTRGVDVIADLFRPNWAFVPQTVAPMTETFQMAVLAAVIGCGSALPIAFLVSRVSSPSGVVYHVGRSVLSVVRSIPDILYALFFIAAVGIGPLAGILALIFFNIGIIAKLQSETIDSVDTGPIEAARASGANRAQWVRWSVLPQVLPNYVAYSLYVFELNIRASTVLGIVGAGGIGRVLYAEYSLFRWSNMSVIIVELFVFVFFIELTSIWLRRRLV